MGYVKPPLIVSEPLRLLCALMAGNQDPYSIDDEEWPHIIALALDKNVEALLLFRIEEAGFQTKHARWESLVQITRTHVVQQLVFAHHMALINAAFMRASIPVIWLKGSALARTIYPHIGCRPMSDLDLLVPYHQRHHALEVMNALEYVYRPDSGYTFGGDNEITGHHYQFQPKAGHPFFIELHFRLIGAMLPLNHMDWFWNSTRIYTYGNMLFTSFRPEAHLLHLSAHLILQHQEQLEIDILHFFDFHQLITTSDIDWEVVIQQAVIFRWTYAVERMCVVTTELFGTLIPESLIDQLRTRRSKEEQQMLAVTLNGSHTLGYTQFIMRSLSPLQKVKLMWRILFPTPSYLRFRYNIKENQFMLPYYFYRWYCLLKKLPP